MGSRACIFGHEYVLMTKLYTPNRITRCKMSFKVKKSQKRNVTVTNSDRALEHFDLHYKPVYRDLWPSMRIALLTEKKSCAIMNNFASNDNYYTQFSELGATDIIAKALKIQSENEKYISQDTNKLKVQRQFINENTMEEVENSEDYDVDIEDENKPKTYMTDEEMANIDRTNLHTFMPTKTVYSQTQELRIEEARRSVYTPMDVKVDIIKPRKISIPSELTVMAFPKGDITTFPAAKSDSGGHLCFYCLDAASILPVIAMDLEKGDNVLDLCAAPGGKSLAILQTRLPGSMTCNDKSGQRVKRLLNILQYYIPEADREHVEVKRQSGEFFNQPIYDKVLVDVPCNTDRHSLLDDENNLFCPNRINERIELPKLQKNLLIAGIKSCRPGGCVVYSTCTLSAAQNDGVIQDTIDELWRTSNIDIVVEDLTDLTKLFAGVFRFHSKCQFGQLVLPTLSSNFGPMYFCRLRRVT